MADFSQGLPPLPSCLNGLLDTCSAQGAGTDQMHNVLRCIEEDMTESLSGGPLSVTSAQKPQRREDFGVARRASANDMTRSQEPISRNPSGRSSSGRSSLGKSPIRRNSGNRKSSGENHSRRKSADETSIIGQSLLQRNSTGRNSTGQNPLQRNSTGRSSVERSSTRRNSTDQSQLRRKSTDGNSTRRNSTGQSPSQRNSSARNSLDRNSSGRSSSSRNSAGRDSTGQNSSSGNSQGNQTVDDIQIVVTSPSTSHALARDSYPPAPSCQHSSNTGAAGSHRPRKHNHSSNGDSRRTSSTSSSASSMDYSPSLPQDRPHGDNCGPASLPSHPQGYVIPAKQRPKRSQSHGHERSRPKPEVTSSSQLPWSRRSASPTTPKSAELPPVQRLNLAISHLGKEMISLRQLDVSLLSQLWSLSDNIQKYKQRLQEDALSESMSECSLTSLEGSVLHVLEEHEYENVFPQPPQPNWATHPLYENFSSPSSAASPAGLHSNARRGQRNNRAQPQQFVACGSNSHSNGNWKNAHAGYLREDINGTGGHDDYENLYEPMYLEPLSQRMFPSNKGVTSHQAAARGSPAQPPPNANINSWFKPILNHTYESTC